MENAIQVMKENIIRILGENQGSIYIHGSVSRNDFRLGWSDIDILCLTSKPILKGQIEELVNLRQQLLEEERDNLYYRSFEGAILSLDAFTKKCHDEKVVYWGTSGQRITTSYYFDMFSMKELLEHGLLIHGRDIRNQLVEPTYKELVEGVKNHYEIIRRYAKNTSESIYSAGWMLDIARGIYTLRTGEVLDKTSAGKWALEKGICPNQEVMQQILEIRQNSLIYKEDKECKKWLKSLGGHIQVFADVLEKELGLIN